MFSLCAPRDRREGLRSSPTSGGGMSWGSGVVGGGGLTLVIAIKQIMSGYVGKCLKSGPDRDKIGDSIEREEMFYFLSAER